MVGSVLRTAASVLSTQSAWCPITRACPVGDTCQYEYGAVSLIVDCATEFAGGDMQISKTPTLTGCIEACASNKDCVATSYVGDTCYLKDTRALAKPNPDVIGVSVIRRDKNAPSPPSSASSAPSGFVTVTVTVSPTPSPTDWVPFPPAHPPRPEPSQLLKNPGFEDGTLEAWTSIDDYDYNDKDHLDIERSDNDWHSGNYSLRVLPNKISAPWRFTIEQNHIKVKVLSEYNVSLWVKDHTTECMIKFFWNKFSLAGKCEGTYGWRQCNTIISSWMIDGSDGEWGDLTAFISCPSYASGRFYVDDFTMTEISNPINEICEDRPCSDEIEESPDRWKVGSGEDAGNKKA